MNQNASFATRELRLKPRTMWEASLIWQGVPGYPFRNIPKKMEAVIAAHEIFAVSHLTHRSRSLIGIELTRDGVKGDTVLPKECVDLSEEEISLLPEKVSMTLGEFAMKLLRHTPRSVSMWVVLLQFGFMSIGYDWLSAIFSRHPPEIKFALSILVLVSLSLFVVPALAFMITGYFVKKCRIHRESSTYKVERFFLACIYFVLIVAFVKILVNKRELLVQLLNRL